MAVTSAPNTPRTPTDQRICTVICAVVGQQAGLDAPEARILSGEHGLQDLKPRFGGSEPSVDGVEPSADGVELSAKVDAHLIQQRRQTLQLRWHGFEARLNSGHSLDEVVHRGTIVLTSHEGYPILKLLSGGAEDLGDRLGKRVGCVHADIVFGASTRSYWAGATLATRTEPDRVSSESSP